MGKVIAGINMTLDGFCDHTYGIVDNEIHQHYSELLSNSGAILHGRITYQLMEYWIDVLNNPTGNKAMDEFAVTINNIPKIVFSRTMNNIEWETARLADKDIKEELLELKQQSDKDILVGSRSLIVECMNRSLIDELQLCIHPVIERKGLVLLENINHRIDLKLLKTKTFQCGAVVFYYMPRINTGQ
jgi:dihydrofolate reductase